jgi:hypothetical protein
VIPSMRTVCWCSFEDLFAILLTSGLMWSNGRESVGGPAAIAETGGGIRYGAESA